MTSFPTNLHDLRGASRSPVLAMPPAPRASRYNGGCSSFSSASAPPPVSSYLLALYPMVRLLLCGKRRWVAVEPIVKLHTVTLPEGMYLATSANIQGLVAQGRTVQETLEIAREVARKLLEARAEREGAPPLASTEDVFDYPLVVTG